VPLRFLTPGQRYTATIYRDGPDADYRRDTRGQIVIETRIVTSADRLAFRMAPGGGTAIRLTPAGRRARR
jgi:alpha-glucosidase